MQPSSVINIIALIISCVLCIASLIVAIGFGISGFQNDDSDDLKKSLVLVLVALVMGFFFATACVNESNFSTMKSYIQKIEQTNQAAE